MLRYKRMPKEIFIVRNRITLQAAILDCSEAPVQSHPFFFYKYYYTTTSKLKITITQIARHLLEASTFLKVEY